MVLLIPLVELLILVVGIGMASLSHQNSSGIVSWLSKVGANIPIVGGLLSVEQIVKLDRWLTHEIGRATGTVTRRGVQWFGALTHYQDVVGYWSLYWPVGLYHAVRHLVEHEIPHAINARTKPLAKRIDSAEAQAKAAAGTAHSTVKVIRGKDTTVKVTRIERVAMPHAAEWDWIHKHIDALKKVVAGTAVAAAGYALPHAPSFPIPWNLHLRGIRARLKRVEGLLGVAGIAAIIASLLGVSKSCLKGDGNIGKTARRLCGLDKSLLDSLLLDSLAIVGAISVVEFADAMLEIEDEAVKILSLGIKEFP